MTRAIGVLRLLRPPNVFTAIADVSAGMLVVGAFAPALVGASACLYLAGLVLNDLFDREVDARERPRRPIPSGDVSVGFAAALGTALLLGGVGLAATRGVATLGVAAGVATMILVYDGGVKNTAVGPVAMGLCRAGNFLLGLSAAGIPTRWDVYLGPALLGLYIVALTFVARDEVGGNTARRARAGLAALALIAAGVGAVLAIRRAPWEAWLWFGALVALGGLNWGPLWSDPSGPRTRRAIGGGILLIPVVDATVVAASGLPIAAAGVASLVVPAMILRRWFSPT